MKTKFIEFLRDEEGATAIEYALIAALIAVLLITAFTGVKDGIVTALNKVIVALGGTPV